MSDRVIRYIVCSTLLCVGSLLGSGCTTYSSFQSADSVPKKELRIGGGAAYTSYRFKVNEDADTSVFRVPQLSSWARYGITDSLEVHGFAWFPFGFKGGVKYQLLGGRRQQGVSLSLGTDVSALPVPTSTNADGGSIIDLYVPLYTGYRTSNKFAIYLTPKYILRTINSSEGTIFNHQPAGTLGVQFAPQFDIHVEGSVAYNTFLQTPSFTLGVGFAFAPTGSGATN